MRSSNPQSAQNHAVVKIEGQAQVTMLRSPPGACSYFSGRNQQTQAWVDDMFFVLSKGVSRAIYTHTMATAAIVNNVTGESVSGGDNVLGILQSWSSNSRNHRNGVIKGLPAACFKLTSGSPQRHTLSSAFGQIRRWRGKLQEEKRGRKGG